MSDCLSCECIEGRLKCKRTLQVNFPGKHLAYVPFNESCEQPGCNAVEFIKARRETCEGTRQVKDLDSIHAESYLKDRFNQISIHHQDSPIRSILIKKNFWMLTRAEIEITAKTIFMALFLLAETGKNRLGSILESTYWFGYSLKINNTERLKLPYSTTLYNLAQLRYLWHCYFFISI